jgi:prepilin signal peptidase PulO-like enzyme (type II secretory pathway)
MRCGHQLAALDLVPVFSYLWLRGRCRYCGTKISPQYPLVELAAAALGGWAAYQYPAAEPFAFWFAVSMLLLFIAVYDLRHFIIPWSCSLLLAALALAQVGAAGFDAWSLAAGPLLALPLFLFSLVSGGRWMGWGDAPLELGLGWLLGLSAGLTALVLAFWLGACVGIVLVLGQKRYTMRSELPFAPFLIAGAWAVLIFHVDLFATLPALLAV